MNESEFTKVWNQRLLNSIDEERMKMALECIKSPHLSSAFYEAEKIILKRLRYLELREKEIKDTETVCPKT
jgi:hypothetical protein